MREEKLLTLQHVRVGVVGDGEEMRRHLIAALAAVLVNDALTVDRQSLVGVDAYAEESRVGLCCERGMMQHVLLRNNTSKQLT